MRKSTTIFFLTLLLTLYSGKDTHCSKNRPTKVKIKRYRKGFRLLVNRKPFIIRGVCYNPVPIGKGPTYNFFNSESEPWKVDAPLMKEMGINTIRIYNIPLESLESAKKVIRFFYEKYRIYTIVGDWLGFWNYPAPFYGDKEFRKKVKEKVLKVVKELKDEKGILCWILGNENNYSFDGRVQNWTTQEIEKISDPIEKRKKKAEIYYSLVEEIAKEIKKIDKYHPVGLGNGELTGLEIASKICRHIDFLALVIYRGKTFGNIYKSVKFTFNKPILFSEMGADSYNAYLKKEDQEMQAFFLKSQWIEIYKNIYPRGEGNVLGGVIFEWIDEWWKHNPENVYDWKVHNTEAGWSNPSYYFDIKTDKNLNMNEEWFGIVKQLEVLENGVHKREPRKAFYVLKAFWKDPEKFLQKASKRKKSLNVK